MVRRRASPSAPSASCRRPASAAPASTSAARPPEVSGGGRARSASATATDPTTSASAGAREELARVEQQRVEGTGRAVAGGAPVRGHATEEPPRVAVGELVPRDPGRRPCGVDGRDGETRAEGSAPGVAARLPREGDGRGEQGGPPRVVAREGAERREPREREALREAAAADEPADEARGDERPDERLGGGRRPRPRRRGGEQDRDGHEHAHPAPHVRAPQRDGERGAGRAERDVHGARGTSWERPADQEGSRV